MAFCSLGVAKLIDENLGAAVMACVVSSGNFKPFGNGVRWRSVQVQNVKLRKPADTPVPNYCPVATFSMDIHTRLALVADKLSELNKNIQGGGNGNNNTILIMSNTDADHVLRGLNSVEFVPVTKGSDIMNNSNKNLRFDERVVNIGGVPGIGHLVLYPYTTAHIVERGKEGECIGRIPRPVAEIWHRTRTLDVSGSRSQVHLICRKEDIQAFPEERRIESVNSACLLGQLMSGGGRKRFGLTLEGPVVDSIFAIAAVTETHNGLTHLESIEMLGETPVSNEWYKNTLSGVAAD